MDIFFEADQERQVFMVQFFPKDGNDLLADKLKELYVPFRRVVRGGDELCVFLLGEARFGELEAAQTPKGPLNFSGVGDSARKDFNVTMESFIEVLKRGHGVGAGPAGQVPADPSGSPEDILNSATVVKMKNGIPFARAFQAAQKENPEAAARFLNQVRGDVESHPSQGAGGDPAAQLEGFVKEKMEKFPNLSYREAMAKVQLEHRDLAEKLLDQVRPIDDATRGSVNF